jgi:hypothetical protein
VVGAEAEGVVDWVLVAAPLAVVLGAAAAPAMPAMAPPAASAPVTNAAASSLDMFILKPPWVD